MVMRILKAGLIYFLLVFGAGFALAFIRIPFLVPAFGVRTAELMEMPVMLAVIAWASRRLARTHPSFPRGERLAAGMLALALLVAAELGVACFLGARSPGEYLASRDPVSGGAYLASLVFFALAPAVWNGRAKPKPPSGPMAIHGASLRPATPMIFALATDDRSLRVFEDPASAVAYCEGIDVEEGGWLFWDAQGDALDAVFSKPSERVRSWVLSGIYSLHPSAGGKDLLGSISRVGYVEHNPYFESLDAVVAHLLRCKQARPHDP